MIENPVFGWILATPSPTPTHHTHGPSMAISTFLYRCERYYLVSVLYVSLQWSCEDFITTIYSIINKTKGRFF